MASCLAECFEPLRSDDDLEALRKRVVNCSVI